jgi:GntR family transcriptional regulator
VKRSLIARLRPDESAASPLYRQLAHNLTLAVRDGHYHANEALPSERLLSETLGVSRVTARKAIDELVSDGLVVRRRGSGNYISHRIEQPLQKLSSFSEELRHRGLAPSSRWLLRALARPTPEERDHLGLAAGERVARLRRLRLADGDVMAYEATSLPESILPDPAIVRDSLYEHLAKTRQSPVRATQHIRAVNASAKVAKLLSITDGKAVLFTTRVGFLESGAAIELTYSYLRSDYYDFVAELRRGA